MAIIKCKMCGGDMELSTDKTFGTCEYCGNVMTLPRISDEQRTAAFNRGNHFRRTGEFDKALAVYERMVAQDDTDAEAHWCCALCRFGIEYVEDPATYEWLPTCHRASFDSFLEDVDYQAALANSDGITRRQYQRDAAKIAEVQRGILATSQNEEPFDVFICYKESDEQGSRTRDSILAQEIYYQLTEQGRRVFFARITLEDKGGAEYEPYIFAALNSAKVMITVGTRPEHLNAVWVKNEWSRFLSLMKKDHSKLLLPCYRDMDPYDLPEALSVLQSYDMAKIGFLQDLIRGVNKVLDASQPAPAAPVVQQVVQTGGGNMQALLKRGYIALEDEEWKGAQELFDRVLDLDAENAQAYLGMALAEKHKSTLDQLVNSLLADNYTVAQEQMQAGEPDRELEGSIIEKYVIPEYLPQEKIERVLAFDFSYTSDADAWERKKEDVMHRLSSNKKLARAENYAKDEVKQTLSNAKSRICASFDEKITASRTAQKVAVQEILQSYREHIEHARVEMEERHRALYARWKQEAEQELAFKARKYEEAVRRMETASDEWTLRSLRKDFLSMHDYMDSAEYARTCDEKIQALIEKQKARQEYVNQIVALRSRKNELGVFDFKLHKQLDAQIAELEAEMNKI